MKKVFVLFAFASALVLTSCGGGKPDVNDADAVATYMCDKTKEMMDLAKDLEGNKDKIAALEKEMEEFEKELDEAHKEDKDEFGDKVEKSFKDNCDIKIPGM